METINIKGKEYTPVNQRILEFRTNEKYVNWQLITEIVSISETSVLFKASAIEPSGRVISTGYAIEDKASSTINNFNFVENCETSAVGRCLGNLGIFVDVAVASAEEVKNAIAKQENAAKEESKSVTPNLGTIQIKYGKFSGKKLSDLSIDELKEVCTDKNDWLREKANLYFTEINHKEFDAEEDLIEIATKKEDLPF